MNAEILIRTDISFKDHIEVLDYLSNYFIQHGFVKESYRQEIVTREQNFPTGIELEKYAVAIPHCGAEHGIKPAIYFIRPNEKVTFNRADEDESIDVDMIIALVVTDPQQQLILLRSLFGKLQDSNFVERLLTTKSEQLIELIQNNISLN